MKAALYIPALYYKPNKRPLFLFQTGTHPQNSVSFLIAMEMGKNPPDIRCNPNLYLVNEAKLLTKFLEMEG